MTTPDEIDKKIVNIYALIKETKILVFSLSHV